MLNIWFHEVQLCKVHIIQLVLREFSEPSITQRVENIILPFLDFSKSVFYQQQQQRQKDNNNNNKKVLPSFDVNRFYSIINDGET